MLRRLLAYSLISFLFFAPSALAGVHTHSHGHDHAGEKDINRPEAFVAGKRAVEEMVEKGELDEGWKRARAIDAVEKKDADGETIWAVTLLNAREKDPKRKNLIITLDEKGHVLSSSFK